MFLTVVAAALLATGCGGGDEESASTTSGSATSQTVTSSAPEPTSGPVTTTVAVSTTSAAVAEAARLLAAADLASPESLDAVDAVRFTDEAVDAAADAIASGATGDELWAATWVYGSSGTDPDVLAPLLEADDASVRAMAAAASLALGAVDGGSALVALLDDGGELRGSDPPLTVQTYAASSLHRFVAGPEVAAAIGAADLAGAWRAWWTDHLASLTFDPASRRWSAP